MTGPVKLPLPALVIFRVLGPSLTMPPEPLRVPLLKEKLLLAELTVIRLGTIVPLRVTEVGTFAVSSNKTESPGLKTVSWLLAKFNQFGEVELSQVALLAPLS